MQRNSKPIPLNAIMIQSESSMRDIVEHIELIELLQEAVSKNLNPGLSKHCKVINFRDGTLVINAQHANWATRLRYAVPDIQKSIQINPKLPKVTTIRIVSLPFEKTPKPQTKHKLTMSAKTSAGLLSMAKTTTDPDYSACLEKLSKHAKPKSSP